MKILIKEKVQTEHWKDRDREYRYGEQSLLIDTDNIIGINVLDREDYRVDGDMYSREAMVVILTESDGNFKFREPSKKLIEWARKWQESNADLTI